MKVRRHLAKYAERTPVTIGVLIATYQRAPDLKRCIASLLRQRVKPDEIIAVIRIDDAESATALASLDHAGTPVKVVGVVQPGTVAARNAGLDALTSDIVVMLDDDTEAPPDFLSIVRGRFQADPALGGLGGRDRCFGEGQFDDRREREVGKLRWYGKVVGNHHRGFGELREVDLLKGANMSFRREALANVRFDARLRGLGAQPSEDLCFSMMVKSKGWKLAYDPSALVLHYASQRTEDRLYVGVKVQKNYLQLRDLAYNQVVATWILLRPWQRAAYFVWSTAVGTGVTPGLIQALRFTPSLRSHAWRRFLAVQQGVLQAFGDLLGVNFPIREENRPSA